MRSDIEIAQSATLKPIGEIAARLGIPAASVENYGHYKAKIALDYIDSLKDKPDGKLILVTALSPTPAGEGKTTTTVGLGDALNKIGKKAVICLREPSLGPVFGMKGGAAGGGYAQVVPMEDINLHFTGDFGAIGLAHNLLVGADRQPHPSRQRAGIRRAPHRLEARRRHERPRAARHHRRTRRPRQRVPAPGRVRHRGGLRGDGDLLPGRSLVDLKQRLGNIVVGYRRDLKPDPRARSQRAGRDDGAAQGSSQAESRADAREQSRLHSRRSVRQHRARLQLGARDRDRAQARGLRRDRGGFRRGSRRGEVHRHQVPQVGTSAGGGGASSRPSARSSITAAPTSSRSIRRTSRRSRRASPTWSGTCNNVRNHYGLPCVVSVNHFTADTARSTRCSPRRWRTSMCRWCSRAIGPRAARAPSTSPARSSRSWRRGENELPFRLREEADAVGQGKDGRHEDLRRRGYFGGRQDPRADRQAAGGRLRALPSLHRQDAVLVLDRSGGARRAERPYGQYPRGALAAGAEFIVVVCGDVMTMPGLPKVPSADRIDIDAEGRVVGLF